MTANVRTTAIRMLARREHSKYELKNKLLKSGFVLAEIESLLEDLSYKKLQSDERFIESYINMRSRRGWGPLKIILELKARGIDPKLGEKFLAQSIVPWHTIACNQKNKKFGPELTKNKMELAKQIRHLTRKGFTGEQLKKCIKYEEIS